MSHILDALQKLQEEKTAKLKQTTLTGGILLNQPSRPRRSKNILALATGCLAILLAGLVIWFALRSNQSQTIARKETAATPAVKRFDMSAQAPPAPLTPTVPQQSTLPPAAPSAMQQPAPPATTLQPAPPSPTTPEDDEGGSKRRRSRSAGSAPTSPPPSTLPSATVPVQAGTPDGIKLSGIAWHDTRKLRRAVVNDLLVGEGTEVAGAKILEIRPHLIKVQKNGALFEVVLPH